VPQFDGDEFWFAEIRQEVHIWIGEADQAVPPFHADYLAATTPRARLVSFPGEGHLFPLDHWGEVLRALI
jgi:pimeloyl-ACP methyl ester carboxylesterase